MYNKVIDRLIDRYQISTVQDPDKKGTARRYLADTIESQDTNVYSVEVRKPIFKNSFIISLILNATIKNVFSDFLIN